MSIAAIDPGPSSTGIAYMDRRRIICAKTVTRSGAIRESNEVMMARAESIWMEIDSWLYDKPCDVVVMEGFVGYPGMRAGNNYQTPWLCGYLQRAVEERGLPIAVQTSKQVLNPTTPGNVYEAFGVLKAAKRENSAERARKAAIAAIGYAGSESLTTDHTRSAALHGLYYLKTT